MASVTHKWASAVLPKYISILLSVQRQFQADTWHRLAHHFASRTTGLRDPSLMLSTE